MKKSQEAIILFLGSLLLIGNYWLYNLGTYNNWVALFILAMLNVIVIGLRRKRQR